jgi:hypothetical protein
MSYDTLHEHTFFAHEDPRWLICHCGQYAVRSRTRHGFAEIRLIEPPVGVVVVPAPA